MQALWLEDKKATYRSDVPRPIIPHGEALVQVLISGICGTDVHLAHGYYPYHGIIGHEFVGRVVQLYHGAADDMVKQWTGKRIVGEINATCPCSSDTKEQASTIAETIAAPTAATSTTSSNGGGGCAGALVASLSACVAKSGEVADKKSSPCELCVRGRISHCYHRTVLGIVNRDGCHAEYLTLPVANLHVVPDNVTDEAAVFVEPLAAAMRILEQLPAAAFAADRRVLIMGAGRLGHLTALAIATTPCQLTVVAKYEKQRALLRAHIRDTVRILDDASSLPTDNFDIVIEATGSAPALPLAISLTIPGGLLVLKSTYTGDTDGVPLSRIVVKEITIMGSRCGPFATALTALTNGIIDPRHLIDTVYPLSDCERAFAHAATSGTFKIMLRPASAAVATTPAPATAATPATTHTTIC